MIFLLEMLFFKGPITAKTSVMVQRIIPNDNLEKKIAREVQQLASEEKTTRLEINSTIVGLI